MTRRAFIRDLEAAQSLQSCLDDIHDLHRGEDDGSFTFLVSHAQLDRPAKVTAMITDLSDYPTSHQYLVYASDDTPAHIGLALSDNLPSTTGKDILGLFDCIRRALNKIGLESQDSPMQSEDDEDDDTEYDLSDDYIRAPIHGAQRGHIGSPMTADAANRARHDLRTAKEAGFRVAVLGTLFTEGSPGIVTISCKVKKLGISQEAMKAWHLRPNEYLVLLLRYPIGYLTAEEIKFSKKVVFEARLKVCDSYKPSQDEATNAFTLTTKELEEKANTTSQPLRDTFISTTVNDVLVTRLAKLMKYRDTGMFWSGAEQCYNDHQGCSPESADDLDDEYFAEEELHTAFSDLVTADHLANVPPTTLVSFPLVAMQFALRHFVRCTEFCLICQRTLPHEIEALKPYVCSNLLCLYQYMRLGFGPSIDHEIKTQPLVIDLLVSFCYSSASSGLLRDFPVGLGLLVPPCFQEIARAPHPNSVLSPDGSADLEGYKFKVDLKAGEMLCDDASVACPFATGDWVICRSVKDNKSPVHFRIVDTHYYPSLKIGGSVVVKDTDLTRRLKKNHQPPADTMTPQDVPDWHEVVVQKYDIDFDVLADTEKQDAIKFLLDTLPDVNEMRDYLQKVPNREVRGWVDRISPSAASVLRWIVASNRACIIQIDEQAPPASNGRNTPAYMAKRSAVEDFDKEERVSGMKGWMQFRFAMGAPDKDQRFMQQVRTMTQRLGTSHPTIFAWHGSSLVNWHSIIREGLHFNHVINGRAFGNGVYHSQDFNTSVGYCTATRVAPFGLDPVGRIWPSSILQITTALSLNELVNAPKEYVSSNPYLVVQNLDWIQTRYLFVKIKNTEFLLDDDADIQTPLPLDPVLFPRGGSGPLQLPLSASKVCATRTKRKSIGLENTGPRVKKTLSGSGSRDDPMDLDADARSSVATDDDDRAALVDESVTATREGGDDAMSGAQQHDSESELFSKTKFRPGTLDFSTLPTMPDPAYANMAATRRLQSDLKSTLKVQATTPAHHLGWYIDPSKMENLYHWIIELHSFDQYKTKDGQPIKLVSDMERANVSSIVLEMRFGPSYPFSPPFVRVIRPRFLGFFEGGGGHVTAGGALCMELLTNSGWSSAMAIESVLLQVRMEIASTEPVARLALRTNWHGGTAQTSDYGVQEAVEAYKRACRSHGWAIPADLEQLAADAAVAGHI